jgi:hypothetical protein
MTEIHSSCEFAYQLDLFLILQMERNVQRRHTTSFLDEDMVAMLQHGLQLSIFQCHWGLLND